MRVIQPHPLGTPAAGYVRWGHEDYYAVGYKACNGAVLPAAGAGATQTQIISAALLSPNQPPAGEIVGIDIGCELYAVGVAGTQHTHELVFYDGTTAAPGNEISTKQIVFREPAGFALGDLMFSLWQRVWTPWTSANKRSITWAFTAVGGAHQISGIRVIGYKQLG